MLILLFSKVNIFSPNTPLHDGAVIISENKIAASACMLPLANDRDISKKLGTRHRAAIGISKAIYEFLVGQNITEKVSQKIESSKTYTRKKSK